ncbi:MAG: hypothetical protein M1814_005616 [Vezdaea aestivalis]|nr:MAG: hypothetical protein M1814_005616 [Vezdaea aestivalis]
MEITNVLLSNNLWGIVGKWEPEPDFSRAPPHLAQAIFSAGIDWHRRSQLAVAVLLNSCSTDIQLHACSTPEVRSPSSLWHLLLRLYKPCRLRSARAEVQHKYLNKTWAITDSIAKRARWYRMFQLEMAHTPMKLKDVYIIECLVLSLGPEWREIAEGVQSVLVEDTPFIDIVQYLEDKEPSIVRSRYTETTVEMKSSDIEIVGTRSGTPNLHESGSEQARQPVDNFDTESERSRPDFTSLMQPAETKRHQSIASLDSDDGELDVLGIRESIEVVDTPTRPPRFNSSYQGSAIVGGRLNDRPGPRNKESKVNRLQFTEDWMRNPDTNFVPKSPRPSFLTLDRSSAKDGVGVEPSPTTSVRPISVPKKKAYRTPTASLSRRRGTSRNLGPTNLRISKSSSYEPEESPKSPPKRSRDSSPDDLPPMKRSKPGILNPQVKSEVSPAGSLLELLVDEYVERPVDRVEGLDPMLYEENRAECTTEQVGGMDRLTNSSDDQIERSKGSTDSPEEPAEQLDGQTEDIRATKREEDPFRD